MTKVKYVVQRAEKGFPKEATFETLLHRNVFSNVLYTVPFYDVPTLAPSE